MRNSQVRGPFRWFLDEDFVTRLLERNLSRLNLSRFKLVKCGIFPLKLSKTGGKSVVEFRLRLTPSDEGKQVSRSIIGVWRPDERNARVYRLLQKIQRQGFNGNADFQACKPIAYLDDWNLLLTSKASGSELEEILAHGDHGFFAHSIGQAAQWLARFHTSGPTSDRTSSVEKDRKLLERWSRHLESLYPDSERRLQSLIHKILSLEKSFNRKRQLLVHGDYHPENIFVNDSTVTLTDFERSCMADPARDLGYFLGQFTMKAQNGKYQTSLRNDGLLRDLFLREYARRASSDVLERVPAYEARTYLEILHYTYWGLGVQPNPEYFDSWISRAEECIGAQA